MNERIKELAEQAALLGPKSRIGNAHEAAERFAELVAADAVAKEREACAKLCENEADQISSDHEAGGMYWCAEAIRARSKHEQD